MDFKSFSKLEQKEITEVLEQFGLNEKECEVYFALLEFGKTSITPISKVVRFPPTTVQSVLDRLEKKGLLSVTMRKSRHIYEANNPAILRKILERELQDISNIIPLLKKIKPEKDICSKIRVYYRERMVDIFHEALKTENKLIFEIISAKDLQEILGEKFHFTKKRIQNKVYLKSLRIEEREIKKYDQKIHEEELREAKFLPRELTFCSSIMFWDNKVAFFTTKEEGLTWVVESKVLSETMRQLFDLLWSVSRKMETM